MLVSKIIKTLDNDAIIINEQDVGTLGLIVSELNQPFCTFIDDERYLKEIPYWARMVITNECIAKHIMQDKNVGICIVKNPRNIFFKLHNELMHDAEYTREIFQTRIGKNCNISKHALISENNVIIGENVIIEEFVVIRENTIIGDNCIIRSGAKIGGLDFEFKREEDTIFGVNHYGGVQIGNNVEIQYNTGINKAVYPWDNTVIGDYTKVDMLVHIAHGAKIGRSCMIVAQSGIGGRTKIGDGCWIGFGSVIKNGIIIGNKARVNMGAVVTKSVENYGNVTGNFAIEHERFIDNLKASIE